MITTVTLNPMLDKTVYVDAVRHGEITRARRIETIVGGKGVNVSRQLRCLGTATTVVWFCGGEIGTMLARMLDDEQLQHEGIAVDGITREGVTYLDSEGVATSVFEPPHAVSAGDVQRLVSACDHLITTSSWMVCCGSSPAAIADGAYRDILTRAKGRGIRTAVDSYGLALRNALEAAPEVVKMNRNEYETTLERTLANDTDVLQALQMFLDRGASLAVLTDGERPAFAASPEGRWRLFPPPITCVNATGSGDCMLAGILFGLVEGWDVPSSLRFGAAAGAANAGRWEVAVSSRGEVDAFLPHVRVEQIVS